MSGFGVSGWLSNLGWALGVRLGSEGFRVWGLGFEKVRRRKVQGLASGCRFRLPLFSPESPHTTLY